MAGIVAAVIGAIVVVALPCLLLVGAFLPSYRAPPRARQSECKTNLKGAFIAERSFYVEKDRYAEHPVEVGFAPERGNRYVYLLAESGPLEDRSVAVATPDPSHVGIGVDSVRYPGADSTALRAALPSRVAAQLGVKPTCSGCTCPQCEITMACIGNIDDDPDLDVWTISTAARTDPTGDSVPPGMPFNELNDLR